MLSLKTRERQIARIKRICESFPEVEVRSHQGATFLVRGKKFAYYLIDHHGKGRVELQCKAERGVNAMLADRDPDRFFMPPYMAHHGWIGMYLDVGGIAWGEVEALLADSYRLTAPKTLVKALG